MLVRQNFPQIQFPHAPLLRSRYAKPDALPFRRLWYVEPSAIGFAKFFSRSRRAVIRVYDNAHNVIEMHEHVGAAAIVFPHFDFPRLVASF
jgi:hypothetical protein